MFSAQWAMHPSNQDYFESQESNILESSLANQMFLAILTVCSMKREIVVKKQPMNVKLVSAPWLRTFRRQKS